MRSINNNAYHDDRRADDEYVPRGGRQVDGGVPPLLLVRGVVAQPTRTPQLWPNDVNSTESAFQIEIMRLIQD